MQAWAILVDSLRELRSRSLFWVTLGISCIVAIGLFGLIGFNEDGWYMLWFDTNESDRIFAGSDGARELMMWMFSAFVYWWLTWGAIVLALLSTSSILPGFLAGGAIEITLAKPIRRLWLFLLKVAGALLFVFVQTALTVVLSFVLLGLKADMWIPATLWAIPLIVVQFLYLFALSALVAVVTRSTLASLLITIVFWAMVSFIQFASNQVDSLVVQAQTMIDQNTMQLDAIHSRAAADGRELTPMEIGQITRCEARNEPFRQQLEWIEPWRKPMNLVELAVPKTGDVQRIIAEVTEAPTFGELIRGTGVTANVRPTGIDEDEWESMQDAGEAGDRAIRSVDAPQSLGTSLAFSGLCLVLASVLFIRKDF
jgi:ABC-type transport system involved in multi-copper enzyme maturation permease subunit